MTIQETLSLRKHLDLKNPENPVTEIFHPRSDSESSRIRARNPFYARIKRRRVPGCIFS